MQRDEHFIRKTFKLAEKAYGFTSPNPLVGAVIVKKGKIIACGYHRKAGFPHAEQEAIHKARMSLKGATLFVNLEPCCHWGRTAPCVDAIISAGIKRVVVGTKDPNPLVNGASLRRLRRHGIEVTSGTLEAEARRVNEVFFKQIKRKLPFVVTKIAQSLDGKTALADGSSKWITSNAARLYSKNLRDRYDSVCVGVNTVIKDNPHLAGRRRDPSKIIIDPQLNIPINSHIIRKSRGNVIIFASLKVKKISKVKHLKKKAAVVYLREKRKGFDLREMLKVLYRLGITSVYVEGGAFTLGAFFDQKLVDKCYFFTAPIVIGGKHSHTSVAGCGIAHLDRKVKVRDLKIKKIGNDILFEGYPVFS